MQNTNSSAIFVDDRTGNMIVSVEVDRGINMGKEVDKMSKGNRIKIAIPPGKSRPADAKIASMYATACSIVVNEVVPIFPHWNQYKERKDIFSVYASHVFVSFVTQVSGSFHCCSKN